MGVFGFPAIVAVLSAVGLFWHISQARKGPVTTQQKAMGGAWAALLVLALCYIVWLVVSGGSGGGAQ